MADTPFARGEARVPRAGDEALFNAVVAERAAAAGVSLAETGDTAIASVQVRRGQMAVLSARVLEMFGVELPGRPRRVAGGEVAFVGVGAGRWWALRPGGGSAFAASLARDFAGIAAVTEQGDGWRLLRLSGPGTRALLARGLALDLHPRTFAEGDAATTEIAHIGVTLWQLDAAPTYEIAIPRSFAGSFAHWLAVTVAALAIAARD